jgi:hypothetical protein
MLTASITITINHCWHIEYWLSVCVRVIATQPPSKRTADTSAPYLPTRHVL